MAAWTKSALKELIHETIGENPTIVGLQQEQTSMRQEMTLMRRDLSQQIVELGVTLEVVRSEIRKGFEVFHPAFEKTERIDTHDSKLRDHQQDIATLNSAVKNHITNKKIHLPE